MTSQNDPFDVRNRRHHNYQDDHPDVRNDHPLLAILGHGHAFHFASDLHLRKHAHTHCKQGQYIYSFSSHHGTRIHITFTLLLLNIF